VSESQRKIFIERLNIDPTRIYAVHNGIDLNEFTFQKDKSNYLLFMGRINQDKAVHSTCTLANETKNSLVISGYFDSFDKIKKNYYDNEVKPFFTAVPKKCDGDKNNGINSPCWFYHGFAKH
jgi:glycosyltransferase involved in cell wall biosynthesis